MRNSKRLVVGLVAALIALAAGVYVGLESRQERSPELSIAPDAIARLFATQLNDSASRPQAFAQWRGKTLVINFWATWCPPCREEMPAFSRLQSKYAATGVQFVGIALDTAEQVTTFAQQYPVSYPLLIADSAGAELTRQLGNAQMALPYTLLLDAGGKVRFTRLGRVSEQELERLLQKISVR